MYHTPRAFPGLVALEPRSLLAVSLPFTDVDGDLVTVRVSGNGTVGVVISGGGTGYDFTLTGTDAKSALTISVKQQGGGDGRVRMEGMNDAVLGKFKAPGTDIFGADFVLDQVTLFRAGTLSNASVDLDPPPDKALSVDIARTQNNCDLFFGGDISTFRLGGSTAADFFTIDGRIASLTVQTGLNGFWEADHYGSVTLRAGIMTAKMRANAPDAKGYAFGTVKAPQAINAELEPEDGVGTPGRIKKVDVGNWSGGEIRATGIDTLKVRGDFEPTLAQFTSTPADRFSIRSATIGEEIDGTLEFDGPIKSMKIGGTGTAVTFNGLGAGAAISSLVFTGGGGVDGDFTFATLGRLSSATGLEGHWRATQLDADGLSIGSIRAPQLLGFKLDDSTPGGINSISASGIDESEIGCAFINTITLRPNAHGGASTGTVTDDTAINLHGSNAAGFSLGRLTAAGNFEDSRIHAEGNIDRISVGGLIDSRIVAGVPAFVKTAFETIAGFDPLALINRFTITGAFNAVQPGLINSTVQCATINAIVVSRAVQSDNADEPFGFGATTFGTITLKNAAGQAIKPPAPTVPGDTEPLGVAGSDFVLRKYA